MENKRIIELIEKRKWTKLAKTALKGEQLEGLDDVEKLIITNHCFEELIAGIRRELLSLNDLIPDEFNERLKNPNIKFEWSAENSKYLVILYKLINIFRATELMLDIMVRTDNLYLQLQDKIQSMKKRQQEDLAFSLGLKNAAKSNIKINFMHMKNDIMHEIDLKFKFTLIEKQEAQIQAGTTAYENMRKYLNNITIVLGV
jgi:hypothetical protein